MEALRLILLYAHLVGFALLFGGFATQYLRAFEGRAVGARRGLAEGGEAEEESLSATKATTTTLLAEAPGRVVAPAVLPSNALSKLRINSAMLIGAVAQVITGVALAAPLGREIQPDPLKLAVKGLISVLILIMVWVVRRKETVARGHFLAIGMLTLVNAAVATFWR